MSNYLATLSGNWADEIDYKYQAIVSQGFVDMYFEMIESEDCPSSISVVIGSNEIDEDVEADCLDFDKLTDEEEKVLRKFDVATDDRKINKVLADLED